MDINYKCLETKYLYFDGIHHDLGESTNKLETMVGQAQPKHNKLDLFLFMGVISLCCINIIVY